MLLIISCANKFNSNLKNIGKGGELSTIIQSTFSDLTSYNFNITNISSHVDEGFSGISRPYTVYMGNDKQCLSYLTNTPRLINIDCTKSSKNTVNKKIIHTISSFSIGPYKFIKFNDKKIIPKMLYMMAPGHKLKQDIYTLVSINELSEIGEFNDLSITEISNIVLERKLISGDRTIFIMEGGEYFSILAEIIGQFKLINYKINQDNYKISEFSIYDTALMSKHMVFFEKDSLAVIIYHKLSNGKYNFFYDVLETAGEERKISSKISTDNSLEKTLGNIQSYTMFDYDLKNNVFILFYAKNKKDSDIDDGAYAVLTKLEKNIVTGEVTNQLTEIKVSDDIDVIQFDSKNLYVFSPNAIKYIVELDIWALSYGVKQSSGNTYYYARFYKKSKDNKLIPLTQSIKFDEVDFDDITGQNTSMEYIPLDEHEGNLLLTYCKNQDTEIKFKKFNIEIKKTFISTTVKVTTTFSELTTSSIVTEEKTDNTNKPIEKTTVEILPNTTVSINNVTKKPFTSTRTTTSSEIVTEEKTDSTNRPIEKTTEEILPNTTVSINNVTKKPFTSTRTTTSSEIVTEEKTDSTNRPIEKTTVEILPNTTASINNVTKKPLTSIRTTTSSIITEEKTDSTNKPIEKTTVEIPTNIIKSTNSLDASSIPIEIDNSSQPIMKEKVDNTTTIGAAVGGATAVLISFGSAIKCYLMKNRRAKVTFYEQDKEKQITHDIADNSKPAIYDSVADGENRPIYSSLGEHEVYEQSRKEQGVYDVIDNSTPAIYDIIDNEENRQIYSDFGEHLTYSKATNESSL